MKIVHERPHHPQSQGQIENLKKQVKKLMARFLQRLPRELQANVWPVLLSAIADLLNNKWHSSINDVPFRICKNREPLQLSSHVIPDDDLWLDGVGEGCLDDYEFHDVDMIEFSNNGQECIELSQIEELAEAIKVSEERILSSSFGTSTELSVPVIKRVLQEHLSPSALLPETLDFIEESDYPEGASTGVAGNDFETENISKFLSSLSESNRLTRLDVLEATEHTIHKNHKRLCAKPGSKNLRRVIKSFFDALL